MTLLIATPVRGAQPLAAPVCFGYAESVRNNVGDEEFLDRAAAIGMAPKDWRKQLPTA